MTDRNQPIQQDDTVLESEGDSIAKAEAIAATVTQQTELKEKVRREIQRNASIEAQGDDLVDQLKQHSTIFEVYERVIGGKTARQWGTRPDGNLATCPMPNHPDRNPSTSFSEDGVWLCFSCDSGGDVIDLYAIAQGMSVPGYRHDPDEFRECLENACALEGIEIPVRTESETMGDDYDQDAINAAALEAAKTDPGSIEQVEIVPEPEPDVPEVSSGRATLQLEYAGGTLVPENTFLNEWMQAHADSKERSPKEYHFFCGLAAMGLAVGRNTCLDDAQGDVYGNLGIVLYGHTGARKSAAIKNMGRLIDSFAMHNPDDKDCTGVRKIVSPASGEALIEQMRRVTADGADQEEGEPVRAVLALDELEGFMKVMNRQGSTLQDAVMQFLDGNGDVGVMSKGSGFQRVHDGILSFVTATQPNAVQGFIGNGSVSNGFMNRYLFVFGEPTRREIDATKVEVAASAGRLKAIEGWSSRTATISTSREVLEMFVSVAEDIIDPILIDGDNHLLNRIELHHKRLAFLFAVNEMSSSLTARHVDMATHLLTSFIIPTFNAADEDLDRKALSDVLAAIMEFVREKFDAEEYSLLTRGTIRNRVRACRKNPDIVDRAFEILIKEEALAERVLRSLGGKKRLIPYDKYLALTAKED